MSTMIDPRLYPIVAAQPHPLVFATISGPHLYGFPSPDSDYDLRGVHMLPLRAVLGLEERRDDRRVRGARWP
jgi:predicted nucleotidyltransferase